ncbi:unnamed protein product [Microthlaspi erraticum]|uniref:NTF2 domain-containing protein n=1 Tax=Microthlaspi erraticum TaxID=1685480 RepID=A0A6D2KX43_9BRAS|nr:unnamed protein product [Microthlaspi erraticum]
MDPAARVPAPVVDPLTVGKAFFTQYYEVMYTMPAILHQFYQEISKVGRVGEDGVMRDFSTLQGITKGLETLSYGGFKSAEITSYDIQESLNGSFLLVVTGFFLNEIQRRKFTQTFFLAPQETGYFVLNDIFRFVSEPEPIDGDGGFGKDSESPSPFNGNNGSEQAACVSGNPVCKKVSKPMSNENASAAKENVLVPEIGNEEAPNTEISCKEVAEDSLKISDKYETYEDAPKKSYASVLKVAKDGVFAGSSLSPKQIPKTQEQQESSDPSPVEILKEQGHQASLDPYPVIESDAVSEVVDATENENNQGFEVAAEGRSIYVRHLPPNATVQMLEAEFKQFGAIGDGGIQVINQFGFGFPFGFVEFKDADAAQRAIEASPVRIGGQKAFVEEKLSTGRGNNRGSGNEYGNRNVGVRGRGRGSYGFGNNHRRGGGGGRSFNRRGNEFVASLDTY